MKYAGPDLHGHLRDIHTNGETK